MITDHDQIIPSLEMIYINDYSEVIFGDATWSVHFQAKKGLPFLFHFLHDIQIYSLYQLRFYFRCLWFILFGFAIYYGYLLYTPFLDTWYNEPTVIATDQADFPVEKLPFPAITICSNNKIVYRQLESVLRTQPWKGLNKSILNFEEDFINALTALVTAQDDPQRLKELSEGTNRILNEYPNELPKVLRQVKQIFLYIY